jgi:NADPH-dependent 2,4-dienoyl-CoA reductase/sulfur reductase-like enzyme
MSAAIAARHYGLEVLVVDEQPTPGGQIWRNVEATATTSLGNVLGKAYSEGLSVVRAFRSSGAVYEPGTQVWHVESGTRAFMTRGGAATSVEASCILLATGAQERPVPFPGWTLPGVLTVGAAQIVLKTSRQLPEHPVWIAGSGPLPLLYASQLLKAGGQIAGFLDTTPPGRVSRAISSVGAAIVNAPGDILKGIGWLAMLRRRVPFYRHVTAIEALGTQTLTSLRFTVRGKTVAKDAHVLLVHEGVVPMIHPTLSLGCRHSWNEAQASFAPELDVWGETSEPGVFVAGDGAGIGGAKAACLRGEISALRVAVRLGRLSEADAGRAARPVQEMLGRALSVRPFLDKLYRPRQSALVPPDNVLACRCEEVSVGSIRAQAGQARQGPNQVKAFTRAGMGPCQGRLCAYTVANVLADAEDRPISEVGLYRVRPPIKPVTLRELAALDSGVNVP